MVTLVVWNYDHESELEKALIKADISYQLSMDLGHYGIKPPYLIVDGVPLDNARAFKWIKGREKHE